MKAVQHLRVTPTVSNGDIRLRIAVDAHDFGDVFIRTGYTDISAEELSIVAVATAAIAGQAVLAPRITIDSALNGEAFRISADITQLFYDSHAYAQDKPFVDVSTDVHKAEAHVPKREVTKKCLLLWSGGKDSLFSLLMLRANGYDVTGIHMPANFLVTEHEKQASQALAKQYGLELLEVFIEWDVIRKLLLSHSTSYDVFPFMNTVPHGRDFLLAAIAAIAARRTGARYICTGVEREFWHRTFVRDGREVVRFDMYSAKGCTLLNQLLENTLQTGFFSPMAAFSEFSVVKHLTEHEPASWKTISSCYWDNWCGKCGKCTRYALIQHTIGKPLITFRSEPIAQDNPSFMQMVQSLGNRQAHYWETRAYCIAELYKRGELDNMPEALGFLKGRIDPLIAMQPGLLKTLEELIHPGLAPEGFEFNLDALGMQ